MQIFLFTTDQFDPISHALLAGDQSIIQLTLQEFMQHVEVFDYLDPKHLSIHWQYNDVVINNDQQTLLLNRVCQIPTTLFNDFNSDDAEYALSELEAYLGFALNAFNSINRAIDERGCVPCYSLPYQWRKTKKAFNQIQVPGYYWGDARFNHLNKENLIYSDIYRYDLWRVVSAPQAEKSVFCFERPKGQALISLVIGDNVLLTGDLQLSEEMSQQIKLLSVNIAQDFNYFICEMLFFIEEKTICFGCVSPYVIESDKAKGFSVFVNQSIACEIEQYA